MKRLAALKRFIASPSGFTLPEVLAGVGILTMALSFVGTSLFQALPIQRSWREDAVAVKEWRNAASWFAGDALNTETTDLVDGAPPVSSVTLGWTDGEGLPHTATYQLSGNSLMRDFDGEVTSLARRVVAVRFSLAGRLLTLGLDVQGAGDSVQDVSLQTFLRMAR